MGERRCPKWPTAFSNVCLSVTVDLGWVSRDVIERIMVRGFPAVASYVTWRADHGSCALDIYI